jgi:poly-gamma-glutamate capsule biosynthesis protein CapA/YwtB (metallophosphatase superfamily)
MRAVGRNAPARGVPSGASCIKERRMAITLMFTGDVNLMNVTRLEAPFARVKPVLQQSDALFGNLECCFYAPSGERSVSDEGFYAAPAMADSLRAAGYAAVGTANNVNYGREAILGSLQELDRAGIKHTGSGADRTAARAPAIVTRDGARIGYLQRTSVYWPTNHEAGEHTPGVAALKGHTAYHVPAHKLRPEMPPANRPGVPPEIITWTDPAYLAQLGEDIANLKREVDIVVASHHWGLLEDVLHYMTETAHAAIDAGADMVIGHGPHYSLPVEVYRGKPIFYGLGSFSFHTGHYGRKHGDWVGMLARVKLDGGNVKEAAFRLVRHNDDNETYFCDLAQEGVALDGITRRTTRLGTKLSVGKDEVAIVL